MNVRSWAAVLLSAVLAAVGMEASAGAAPAVSLTSQPPAAIVNPGPVCGVPLWATPDMVCLTTPAD